MDQILENQEGLYNLAYLKSKLDESKIKNEIVERYFDEGSSFQYLLFHFPVARNFEEIRVYDDDDIENIINSYIFKYRGISNYEAIWSSELKCIECQLQNPRSMASSRYLLNGLSRYFEANEESADGKNNNEPTSYKIFSSDKVKVSIGYSSKEFAVLTTLKEGRRLAINVDRNRYRATLRIENIAVKTEEEARNYLEKISNTLFYQADVLYNLTLTLSPRRISRDERIRRNSRRTDSQGIDLREISLSYEYDKIPMSLYWFAQNSVVSPIFMYLALYQVLEFYFPIYATMNLKTKIQNLIKDPKFNINKDYDVVRLLSLMKTNNINSIGDEREQLLITLRNVTSGEEILEFIGENDFLREYYASKATQKLSDRKPRLSDNNGIVEDMAERVYDIRCRIVHNKASETNSKILPMTKEVDYLVHEIEMLKFLARKVINANARPFAFS